MTHTCKQYQAHLALRADEPDQALQTHLEQCSACAAAAKRHTTFDVALKSAIIAPVPNDLTARLLALIPGAAQPFVRSKRWMRQRRLFLVLFGGLGVLALALLMFGIYTLGSTLGLGDVLATVGTWPGIAIEWLYRTVPSSRSVVAFMLALRGPLQWVVLAALVWAVLERTPRQSAGPTLSRS